MKQYQINNAYNTLRKLANMPLPMKEAYDMYRLLKALDVPYQFEIEKERELFNQCGGVADENGNVRFPDRASEQKFRMGLQELGEMDPKVEFTPVALSLDKLSEQEMTPIEIASLDGFVRFE